MKRFKDTKYLVTKDGRVYSERRNIFLKTFDNGTGYIKLRISIDSKTYNKYLHRMVAEVYIPNPDNKPEVNHKNGIKADCSVDNLEWNTKAENIRHAHDNGLMANCGNKGEFNINSKVTETDVLEIYKLKDSGVQRKDIAKRFPITYNQIGVIVRGDSWSDLYKQHYG